MAIALAGGVPAAKIQMHGNAKSELDLERAVEVGIGAIVVDNLRDLDRLERLAGRSGKQRIYLRIAPGVSPDTHPAISTGGPNTKFGFDLEHAPAAIARAQQIESLELAGLHFHIGSQIFDLSPSILANNESAAKSGSTVSFCSMSAHENAVGRTH